MSEECIGNVVCHGAQQNCIDPSPLVGDWYCSCTEPLVGTAIAKIASCQFIQTAEPSSGSSDDDNLKYIIGLIAAGFVLLCCALLVAYMMSKSKEKERSRGKDKEVPDMISKRLLDDYKEEGLLDMPGTVPPPPLLPNKVYSMSAAGVVYRSQLEKSTRRRSTSSSSSQSDINIAGGFYAAKSDASNASSPGIAPTAVSNSQTCSICNMKNIMPWALKCPSCQSPIKPTTIMTPARLPGDDLQLPPPPFIDV